MGDMGIGKEFYEVLFICFRFAMHVNIKMLLFFPTARELLHDIFLPILSPLFFFFFSFSTRE